MKIKKKIKIIKKPISIVLWRVGLYLGLISFLVSLLMIVWSMCVFAYGVVIPGWFSILIPMLLIGSLQLVSLGMVAEYIGKLYLEILRERKGETGEGKKKVKEEKKVQSVHWIQSRN